MVFRTGRPLGRNYLRVRGEYPCYRPWRLKDEELPPRARRIHYFQAAGKPVPGTTSACAENTQGFHAHMWANRNYLRVRGEYQKCNLWGPRLIGTTSACAENTPWSRSVIQYSRNYLRVRGEYWETVDTTWVRVELPPRARRIRTHGPLQIRRPGTTSACAENTTAPP